MKTKLLLLLLSAPLLITIVSGQNILSSSLNGTFIEGVSPVENTITADAPPSGTAKVIFYTRDLLNNDTEQYTDDDDTDGFTWNADMGLFPEGTVIYALYFDATDIEIDKSDDLILDIIPTPTWLAANGSSVSNVDVTGNIISFTGHYPICNLEQVIPEEIKGIGDKPLNIAGEYVFDVEFDMSIGQADVQSSKAVLKINILDQFPDYEHPMDFSTKCTLDNNLNLTLNASNSIETKKIKFDIPGMTFPVGITSIKVDAGMSLYATLKGQIIIGQSGGEYGFVDDNGDRTKITAGLIGNGFIRGEVSVLGGLASANAKLNLNARLGAGFEYLSTPSVIATPLLGGDIKVSGEVCFESLWGLGPGDCSNSEDFYSDSFGDPNIFRKKIGNSFDEIFGTSSITFKKNGSMEIPNFNPQPSFGTRDTCLYAVWIESDGNNTGYLLFSKLNSKGTSFSEEIIVEENKNSISNPKIALLPSGAAIITWSQSRYTASTIPIGSNEEDKVASQDVWFAIYDNNTDNIVFKERLADDFSSLESGRAEGEAKISVGDGNDAMITWIVKDANSQTSDVWFTHLTETSTGWELSAPEKLADLSGINSNVQLAYTDTSKALAVWVNDPDGSIETTNNKLLFSEWDGTKWSNPDVLADNDSSIDYKQISMSSNFGYTAVAYTSINHDQDGSFENRLDIDVWDDLTEDWDSLNHFEDSDSNYYFQNPKVSISKNGIASICYQVIDMFPDTNFIDNGELYLYLKDLTDNVEWKELTNNPFICDTNAFIWELTAGFGGEDKFYTLTQEYNNNGIVTSPRNGIKFGDPALSMVLRGLQVNDDLTLSNIQEPTAPTGIKKIQRVQDLVYFQNYPNPFSDNTIIEFQLQHTAKVQLAIYDLTGRLIVQLLDSELQTGIYKTQFDAGNLPSGFYFCKLTINNQSVEKKMIIAK